MKLKLDENGNAILTDGKPTYVGEDGKDFVFDAPQMYGKITELTKENVRHREAKEAAEKALKSFEGIDDAQAARKALETLKALDQKKLIDAGEVEKVKEEISKAFQSQLDEVSSKAQTLEQQLYAEKIGGSFARSKLIAEKLAVPADMVQAAFGSRFKIEDGKVVAYDGNGQKIFSRARPGEFADFDEALESLIDQYPHKDHILKGTGATGSGASPGGGPAGARTYTRAQFAALSPAEQATVAQKAATQEVTITD